LLLLLLLASENPIEHFAMKRALWSKRVEQQQNVKKKSKAQKKAKGKRKTMSNTSKLNRRRFPCTKSNGKWQANQLKNLQKRTKSHERKSSEQNARTLREEMVKREVERGRESEREREFGALAKVKAKWWESKRKKETAVLAKMENDVKCKLTAFNINSKTIAVHAREMKWQPAKRKINFNCHVHKNTTATTATATEERKMK